MLAVRDAAVARDNLNRHYPCGSCADDDHRNECGYRNVCVRRIMCGCRGAGHLYNWCGCHDARDPLRGYGFVGPGVSQRLWPVRSRNKIMGCDGRMLETIVTSVVVVQLEIAVAVLLIVVVGHRRSNFVIVTKFSGQGSHPTKIEPRRNSKTKFLEHPNEI